ncbi:MAG TPA: carboxypeptidase-like regulatory domain-containing protein, partial [Blastocatellia bacterium]|nr:carboxypeptidase-like regulatory domain-containing protein [Blastocatellia bacterium]
MSQKSKFVSLLLISALILSQLTSPMSALASSPRARRMVKTKPDTITGTLQGRVIDPGELPLADVRVRVINEETGNVRATKTGANGWYKINLLPLGLYKVEATKEGFNLVRPANQMKIRLNETVTTAPDIVLGPEPPTPPPTVATSPAPPAPAPSPKPAATTPADDSGRLTNQIDPTRRANSDERMVSLLPLTGVRSFDDLALQAAGVAPPPQVRGVAGPGIGAGIGTAGQFSVNGQRARANNFTVDGSDNNDEDVGVRRQGFVALVPQSIESIKEIQIVTHLWDAEHGRSAGSQVNAVSKSGTNRFHGQLYDFFNHSALNARNFFDYSAKNAPPTRLTAMAIRTFVDGKPVDTRLLPVQIDGQDVVLPNPSQGKD